MKTIIAKKRKEKGMTQQELGNLIGVSDRVISKWETGKSVPDTSILNSLCAALGITINELFGSEEEATKLEMVADSDFKTKYENLSIIGMVIEIITGILLIIGRIIYQNDELNYETSKFVGIVFIIMGSIILLLGISYLIITRNNLISSYSKYIDNDKKMFKKLIIGLFVVAFAVSFTFVLEHGLEKIEELIIIIICLFLDSIVCGLLAFFNKKRN